MIPRNRWNDRSDNMQNPHPHHHQASASCLLELDDPDATGKWAAELLRECARAISEKDSGKIHRLMWMLNELASPYGDCEQKLASYFLQALFCKATESGERCYKTSLSVAEMSHSFESTRKVILQFQEVSPWTTFGHVASNGAILEALEGEAKLHIIDISNTYCTQWPTLLEALATRNGESPHLRLTVVATAGVGGFVMDEIGQRMGKFARLMGVPFEFRVIRDLSRLDELREEELGLREGEAVAVNCIGALRRVDVEQRHAFIGMLGTLRPRVVTVVEEEADFTSCRGEFAVCFDECLRFYTTYFETLEESFAPTSNERLALERECSRSILRVLACDGDGVGDCERREKGSQWCRRLIEAFSPNSFNDDVVDDLKALLKRYRAGWSLTPAEGDASGLYLTWKQQPVVWACAWKP
ncbi:hypothetical protein BHM03_00004199 [Ensete ventricosum]|uniref:Uncharacterized protein n=1 Tax=Ensete ventricosum TaxID=4639 RepID=A0A445MAG1_ENSVE|nr:hypothetical protein BHM03_00004199 [Ensete ventricosum]